MKPITDMHTKFYDNASHIGHTKLIRTKFVVLPHVYVARSCPILKHGATKPPASDLAEIKKWKLWQHLLSTSYVLHCFPPDSMPCGSLKHGEKGCDKSVIMGSAVPSDAPCPRCFQAVLLHSAARTPVIENREAHASRASGTHPW